MARAEVRRVLRPTLTPSHLHFASSPLLLSLQAQLSIIMPPVAMPQGHAGPTVWQKCGSFIIARDPRPVR